MKHRQPTRPRAGGPGGQSGFQLPPDISFSKQPCSSGWDSKNLAVAGAY